MIEASLQYLIFAVAALAFYTWTVRRGSLTRGGAIAAVSIALTVVVTTGWFYLLPLLLFFGSSVLVGKLFPASTEATDEKHGKGRDAIQVLANGGLYALLSVVCWYDAHLNKQADIIGFAGPLPTDDLNLYSLYALAAIATADTWSSEIGQYFSHPTYDLIRWSRVPPGLSGGVSVVGTIAGLLGSGLISLLTLIDPYLVEPNWAMVWIIGFLGMLIDSVLGSLIQVKYTYRETDERFDAPLAGSTQSGGFKWINNDAVNALSLLIGLVLLYLLYPYLNPTTPL